MISLEQIEQTYATRKQRYAPTFANLTQIRDLYNADLAVPLPEIDRNEKPAVTNLLASGINATAQRINSTLPDVYFPPLKPGQTRSETQAETARRAVLGWWGNTDMQTVMARRARHLVGYGMSPVVIRPDKTLRHARWEVRDPLTCYPAATLLDTCTPSDVIFAYTRSVGWLQRNYPQAANVLHLNGYDDKLTVIEYSDSNETVLLALGQSIDPYQQGQAGAARVELSRAVNLAGITPVVLPTRVTLDRLCGQFDALVPMFVKQAKLDALEYIAIEQGVFPRQWLVARQGETPQIVVVADGRKGEIGIVKGGVLQEETINPGYKTTEAIDRLASEQRLAGNVPAEMQGVSGTNIRTGRRGDEVLSEGIDFGIQEAQRLFETSMREENTRAVAITKAWFGTEKHSFYVSWRGAQGPLEYVPNEVFVTDHNVVKYALAGSDLNGQVVRTGQKLGAGLISKKTARRNDPEINDPDFEDHQIVAEQLEQAFLQGLSQQATTGALSPVDMARLVELVKIQKMQPIEAFNQVQKEAQSRQATTGAPGTPEAPAAPGSPEAQPGVAAGTPGTPAGVAIGPPPAAADNLRAILRNVGQGQSMMQRAG